MCRCCGCGNLADAYLRIVAVRGHCRAQHSHNRLACLLQSLLKASHVSDCTPFTSFNLLASSLRAGLSEPYCFFFFLFPVSIPPMFMLPVGFHLHYHTWALCDSNGAWTKLWSNQRCFIKCFSPCILHGRGCGTPSWLQMNILKCKNQTMTHKQKICIAGYRRSVAYEWTDSYTERDKALTWKERRGLRVFDQPPKLVPLDSVFNLTFILYNPVSCVPKLVFHFPS